MRRRRGCGPWGVVEKETVCNINFLHADRDLVPPMVAKTHAISKEQLPSLKS